MWGLSRNTAALFGWLTRAARCDLVGKRSFAWNCRPIWLLSGLAKEAGRAFMQASILWRIVMHSPALASGDVGHRVVCQIAYELKPEIKARADALVAIDPKFRTFADGWTLAGFFAWALWRPSSIRQPSKTG